MELITILNRCHRFRGFVYQHAHLGADKKGIEVAVRPRKGSTAVCSRCHLPAPGYDQLAERRFEFIPLWGFLVFLLYTMRRVDRRRCGVVAVEEVPWGDGKRTLTKAYMLFLARWARRLSWKETAEAFRASWDKVFDAVEHVVTFGLEHRVLGQIDAIGVDEIQHAKGHKYLTLVYQIDLDVTRLLWVGRERTIESLRGFLTVIGDELASKIVFVCSDMWEPYLKVNGEEPIMERKVTGDLSLTAFWQAFLTIICLLLPKRVEPFQQPSARIPCVVVGSLTAPSSFARAYPCTHYGPRRGVAEIAFAGAPRAGPSVARGSPELPRGY
jgi:hypothetical protein